MILPLTNLSNSYDTSLLPSLYVSIIVTAKKIHKMEDGNSESYKLAVVTG